MNAKRRRSQLPPDRFRRRDRAPESTSPDAPAPRSPDAHPALPPSPLVLSRDAVRLADRLAAERFHIPSILMMENAAIGVADLIDARFTDPDRRSALICCGKGNNGGDGLATARHLHNRGWHIELALLAEPDAYSGDAAINLRICSAMRLPLSVALQDPRTTLHALAARAGGVGLIIDALLGTGLQGPVTGPLAHAISAINELARIPLHIVAIDLPSGLDADTGEPLAATPTSQRFAVRASITATLAALKPGLLRLPAQQFAGEVTIIGIGVPIELLRELGSPLDAPRRPGEPAGPHATPPAPATP